jgi:NitT/TauT family transport system substrate-binding protein
MPKRILRPLIAAAVLFAITVFAAACGSSNSGSSSSGTSSSSGSASSIPSKPEAGVFRMGIEPWLGYGPWRIAEAKGIFKKNGLNVKIVNFSTDDQINSAFASGKIDGTNVATHTALRFVAQGLPLKAVLLEDVSLKADAILSGPGINSIKDLNGKKVAYEEGTTSDILLAYALAQNGMSKKDIQPVPIPASDAGTAFLAGRVPVAVTYEPYLTTALQKDKNAKLLYTAGKDPGLVGDVFAVSNDTIKNKPGQVAALIRSWAEAVAYYNKNKADAQAIITKAVGSKPGDLKTAFEGVKLYDLAENKQQLSANGDYVNKTIEDVAKAAKTVGLLENPVDPKTMLYTKFVEQAK